MNLKELYAQTGGEYESALQRLHSENMLMKFVKKYAEDMSYSKLMDGVRNKDWEAAFRAAHTMKGIAQNLGFTVLQVAAEELTEDLRGASELSSDKLLEAVSSAHAEIIRAVAELEE